MAPQRKESFHPTPQLFMTRFSRPLLQDLQWWLTWLKLQFFLSQALELLWQLLSLPDVHDIPYLHGSTVRRHAFDSSKALWDHWNYKPECAEGVGSAKTASPYWLNQDGVVNTLCLPGNCPENLSSRKHLESERSLSDLLMASKAYYDVPWGE